MWYKNRFQQVHTSFCPLIDITWVSTRAVKRRQAAVSLPYNSSGRWRNTNISQMTIYWLNKAFVIYKSDDVFTSLELYTCNELSLPRLGLWHHFSRQANLFREGFIFCTSRTQRSKTTPHPTSTQLNFCGDSWRLRKTKRKIFGILLNHGGWTQAIKFLIACVSSRQLKCMLSLRQRMMARHFEILVCFIQRFNYSLKSSSYYLQNSPSILQLKVTRRE